MKTIPRKKCFLFLLVFLTISCSKKESLKEINLVKGLNTNNIHFQHDSSLTLQHKSSVNNLNISIYKQRVNNKEIVGSYIKKVETSNGNTLGLIGLTSELKTNVKQSKFFQSKSLDLIKEDFINKHPELKSMTIENFDWVYLPIREGLSPSYQMIYSDKNAEIFEILFDAKLNTLSQSKLGSQFADIDAIVFPKGPKMSQLEPVILKNIEVDNGIKSINFKVSSVLNSKIEAANEIVKIPITDDRFDQIQVSFYIQKSFDWFVKTFNSKIPFMVDIQVHVGAPEKSNTAFYYANKIRFGSGDDVIYSHIPRDPTIIIHESNHAIIDYLAHLPFDKEGGSLNEGLADFLTTLQLNNPNLGEVSFLKGPFRRTVKNDLKFTDRKGGLYGDSAIISGLLWNFKETLGDELAGKIAVNTLMLLGPMSDFNDFNNKLKFVIKTELKGKDLEAAEKILKDRNWFL